jgi:hypothetical protein
MANRFRLAIDAQDAGNLRALARAFVRVVDEAAADNPVTEAIWADPAVRLFVNQFENLCRSADNYEAAWHECETRAKADEDAR